MGRYPSGAVTPSAKKQLCGRRWCQWGGAVPDLGQLALPLGPRRCRPPGSPSRTKVGFIFFSGEERGLLGSAHYVSKLTKK